MDPKNNSNLGTTTPTTAAPLATSTPNGSFATAFLALRAEIAAVKNSDLLAVNVNVPAAVLTVRGAAPRLKALRSEIESTWRDFDLVRFDKIEAYALAAAHTESIYMFASQPTAAMPELQQQASEKLSILMADAEALARRGYIDAKRIEDVRVGPGYKDTAFQLLGIVNLLRDAWPSIAGHTAIEPKELLDTETLVDRITVAVAQRAASPVVVSEAQLTRQRAFTLMVNAYELGRSAVQFLRREEGDADEIAPSVYAGRGGRKRAQEDVPDAHPGSASTPQPHANPTPAQAAAPAASTSPVVSSGPLLPALHASYPGNDPFRQP